MAGQNWRKNKKGFMVNPEGKTRRQVLAEKRRGLDKKNKNINQNKKKVLSDREVDYIAKSSNLSSQQVREFYAQGKLGNEKTVARFKRDANLSDKLKNIKPTRKFSESEQSLIDKTIKEVKEGKTSKKQIEQARDKQISEFLRVTGDRSIKYKSDKKRRYQAYREIQGLNYVLNQV